MHRRGGFRSWAILLAVLQFALPTAVAYADARLERESAPQRSTHVESSSRSACRPVHPGECALCQFLSSATALAERGACAAATVARPLFPIGAPSSPAPDRPTGLSLARAPPGT